MSGDFSNSEQLCPHCRKQLQVTHIGKDFCPYCGVRLSDSDLALQDSTTVPPPLEPTPPPITRHVESASNDRSNTASSRKPPQTKPRELSSTIVAVATSAKSSARIAAAKAKELQLTTIDLPKAFLVLGSEIYQNRRSEVEFADLYAEMDEDRKRIDELNHQNQDLPIDTVTNAAKAMADTAQRAAKSQALKLRAPTLIRRLGHEAFKMYGAASGPPELIDVIQTCQRRIEELRQEIRQAGTETTNVLDGHLPSEMSNLKPSTQAAVGSL